MLRPFRGSLRKQLCFFVAISLIPALAVILFISARSKRTAEQEAKRELISLVHAVGTELEGIGNSTEQLLSTLAHVPLIRRPVQPDLSDFLEELRSQNSLYANLLLLDASGDVLASARPLPTEKMNLGDRSYFQDALRTGRFVIGNYTVGRIVGQPVVHMAIPIPSGSPAAGPRVLAAALDVTGKFDSVTTNMPEGSHIVLSDRNHVIVHATLPDRNLRGTPDPERIRQKLSGGNREGVFHEKGLDGVPRLIAYRQLFLNVDDTPDLFLRIGVPESVVMATGRGELRGGIILLVCVAALAFALAWYFGDVIIARRIQAILRAAQRVADGDLRARVEGLRDHGGELEGLAKAFDDMALSLARREEESRRIQEERSKEERLRSLGLLAGGIAHDFNNLLTAILGHVSLLQLTAPEGSKEQRSYIDMERAVLRARNLTEQLLIFARGGKLERKIIDAGVIINESAALCMTGSPHEFVVHCDPGLWPVEASPVQIGQLVHNLVINSCQAMRRPGVIRVMAHNFAIEPADPALPLSPGQYVLITITDEGEGIAPEDLKLIFDPFFTKKKLGHGLGLASVYSIVKSHGGHIEVASTVGRGSTFSVYLPATPGGIIESSRPGAVIPHALARILIMDDEPLVRHMLSEMLASLGHKVTLVDDGRHAIEEFIKAKDAGQPFDVCILDVTIKGGLGAKEVLPRLQALEPGVRAIVSSGYSAEHDSAQFKELGFVALLDKPYRLADLQWALSIALSQREPVEDTIQQRAVA